MSQLYFAPFSAVKYVGEEPKEFAHSLARPKPTLKKGDIVVVEKKTAHILVTRGFGDFVEVDNVELANAKVNVKKNEKKSLLEKAKDLVK